MTAKTEEIHEDSKGLFNGLCEIKSIALLAAQQSTKRKESSDKLLARFTMSESGEEAEFNDEMQGEEEEEEEEEREQDEANDGKRAARKSVTSYAEDDGDDDDEDDDSEDDIPLASLAKRIKETAKATRKNGSNKKPPAKKASAKKPAPPVKKSSNVSSSSTDKKYEFASAALYQSECLKGLLIQRLLCRWWYAYEWPDPATLPTKPPENYDTLDGFPGVYVCTGGDEVGKLLDMRDKNACPSFRNFANKPSSELQTLLLKALKNQKAQLVEHEGSGTALEKELDGLIKWTTKVDTNKAEKECVKVLKASKLKL